MNHGRGKSASAIVGVKPTSAQGDAGGAGGAKGGDQRGMRTNKAAPRRAQDRESVTLALDCIREVARQRKKERFTALFHHIDPSPLRMAFLASSATRHRVLMG